MKKITSQSGFLNSLEVVLLLSVALTMGLATLRVINDGESEEKKPTESSHSADSEEYEVAAPEENASTNPAEYLEEGAESTLDDAAIEPITPSDVIDSQPLDIGEPVNSEIQASETLVN